MPKALIVALASAAFVFFLTSRAGASSCSGLSTTPVSFGTYDPESLSDLSGIGRISYTCSNVNGASIIVEISAGNSLSCTGRYMIGGTSRLEYNLYTDPVHASLWGTTIPPCGMALNDHPQNDTLQSDTIYGLIPRLQKLSPGAYSDSLIITITF